jgi:NAD(P)-dependent dehydrogenase (short-subunit alcohol dehydrogenase family)
MTSNRTALVLGATGGVGGEVARRLIAGGWTVLLGSEPHTPLDKAVRETLIGVGCLSRDRVNSHSEHLASR